MKNEMKPTFSLKISEKEKYVDDNDWFKKYMNHIIPTDAAIIEDYDLMKTSYEVVNNNLNGFKDKMKDFCEPLGENLGQIEEEVIPYPEIHNKINVLKGELIKRNDNHKIVMLTSKAIKDKNDKLLAEIEKSVDEKLAIVVEQTKMKLQGKTKEEIEQYMKEQRTMLEPEDIASKNFQSEVEIFYSKGLKYVHFDQDIKTKKIETFEDVIVTDRCFIYSGWKNGKPFLEVRNPLYTGYSKAPNEQYIHKGDYIWYRKPITVADVLSNYDLTEEETSRLGVSTYTQGVTDKRHHIGEAKPVYDHTDQDLFLSIDKQAVHNKEIGTHQASANALKRQSDLVWETHFEFRAFKEVIFLSYVDEYNEQITTVLSSSFTIPKEAVKNTYINRYGKEADKYTWIDPIDQMEYTAERIWVPRKYEMIRLGTGIYKYCREVPNQAFNIEDPFGSFELSTKGAIFTSRNAKSVSLLQRALAPYFQYIYIKHIFNRELAKYRGSTLDVDVDQIPEQLGQDFDGNDIRDKFSTWLVYLKKTGINFYSGSQNSMGGLPPATRSPGSKGTQFTTAVELFNLQNLLELIRKEIGLAMGISPQREANFTNGTNVSDNKQALQQSYHITEPYFYIHAEIWKHAINDWLKNFRIYCKSIFEANPKLKEHSIHYFMPDGTEELMKVIPESLDHSDIGLYVSNSGQDQAYLDFMMQQGQAFAQNRGEGMTTLSSLVKAITGGSSPEEIHKMIIMEEKRQNERMQEIEKSKQQHEQQLIQMQIDAREDVQAHEIDKIKVKAEEDRTTGIITSTIQAEGFAKDTDINNNNIPDVVDIANTQLKQQKINLEERQFEHQKEIDGEKLKLEARKINKKP